MEERKDDVKEMKENLKKVGELVDEFFDFKEVGLAITNITIKNFVIPNLREDVKNDPLVQETIMSNGIPVEKAENIVKEAFSFLENKEELKSKEAKLYIDIAKISMVETALDIINMAKFDEDKNMVNILRDAFDYFKALMPYDTSESIVARNELELMSKFFKDEDTNTKELWQELFSRHNMNPGNLNAFLETGTMTNELIEDLEKMMDSDNSGQGKGGLFFITFVFKNDILTTMTDQLMFSKYVPGNFELVPHTIEERFKLFNTTLEFHAARADDIAEHIYNLFRNMIGTYEDDKEIQEKINEFPELVKQIEDSKLPLEELIKIVVLELDPEDFTLKVVRDDTEDKFSVELKAFLESLNTNENFDIGDTTVLEAMINMHYNKSFEGIINTLSSEELEVRQNNLTKIGGLIPLMYNIRYKLFGIVEDEDPTPYKLLQEKKIDRSYIPFIWALLQGFYDSFAQDLDANVSSFDNLEANTKVVKAKWEEAYEFYRKSYYINIFNKRFVERDSIEERILPLTLLMQWMVCTRTHSMKKSRAIMEDKIRNGLIEDMDNVESLKEEDLKAIMSTEFMEENEAKKILVKYSNKVQAIRREDISDEVFEEFQKYLERTGKVVKPEEKEEEEEIIN